MLLPSLPFAQRARAAVLGAGLWAVVPAPAAAQQPAPSPAPAPVPAVQPPAAPAGDTARPSQPDSVLPAMPRTDAPRPDSARASATEPRAVPAVPRANPLAREAVLAEPTLPVTERSPAAAILHVQVLLDAAGFSPGMLDGRWGDNMQVALFTFRDASGLNPDVEQVDAEAYARLRRTSRGRPALTTYVLDRSDVRYPFRPVPRGVAAKARAECLCYESLAERLSERFHASPAVLRALNPGVDFGAASAGQALTVPNTWRLAPPARVARVVVDKSARGMRGLAADGRTLFWLPATVGSRAMPSPHGALTVSSVTVGPHYRWDPAVLRDVSRREPVRMLPPGPNNLVGSVWVALSRPHVGIHGTPDPEQVGYTASHGCVRLTNWDALWFSKLARPGLPVVFE